MDSRTGSDTNRPDAETGTLYSWSFGNITFHEGRWQLSVDGSDIDLERKPLEVLQYLLRHAGEAVTKEELLSVIWADRVVVEAVLTNAIGKLRKALKDEGPSIILTLPRIGYRLDGQVTRHAVEYVPEPSRLKAGDSVPGRGHWMLEETLARGGDGEVWLARHDKTSEIRVFKFSLDGQRLTDLKREVTVGRLLKQALGPRPEFVHAKDWDFDQAPYYIEFEYGGVSLDQWPDIEALPAQTRLDLFIEAVEAVASAHEVGVLHKDLKPANLLVYGKPGDLHVRVADFGSSRVFDQGMLVQLGITGLGLTQTQMLSTDSGTPLYLAPEVLAGQAPSIKSDIYALGVTLYQLLIGDFKRPLSAGWEHDIDDPLLRDDIAAAANGDPAKRPASAHELAGKIRHLKQRHDQLALQEAVQARIAAGEKRLAKVRARRPWLIASVVLLLTGLVATGWFLRLALKAEHAAAEQREVALALNHFVERDILGTANPFGSGDDINFTMHDALERAAPEIDKRFAAQPDIAAPLHATVARAFYHLSDYASAIRHFRAAQAMYAQTSGPDSSDAIMQRIGLAQSLARSGKTAAAQAELAKLPGLIAHLPPLHRAVTKVHYDLALGWTIFEEGKLADAVAPLEDAEVNIALMPSPDPALSMQVNQALMMARGRAGLPVTNQVAVEQRALDNIQRSHVANKVPLALSARYALVRVRMLMGEERTLEPAYRQIIAQLTDLLGPHNETTLLAMHGLALIYMKQEKWPECLQEAGRVHEGLLKLLGASSIQTANAANTYGACLLGEGKVDQAHAVLQSAIDDLKGNTGYKGGLVRTALQINLGHVLAAQGRWGELGPLLNQIQTHGSKLLKTDSDAIGEVDLIEGRMLAAQGNNPGAKAKLQASVRELLKKNPADYWLVRLGKRQLAKLQNR